MRKCFYVLLAWILVSCHTATRGPSPESEQVISDALKDLYMAASTAAPQSPQQQALLLKMADKASNGKELMLAMRAAVGVFPAGASAATDVAAQVRSRIAAKMIQVATLDQLSDFASQYPVDPAGARPYVERMLQLAGPLSDPRAWHRIRAVASHWKLSDLEQQAQARAEQLAAQ